MNKRREIMKSKKGGLWQDYGAYIVIGIAVLVIGIIWYISASGSGSSAVKSVFRTLFGMGS